MKNEMAVEALRWIIHDIEENKTEADAEKADDFSAGRAQAYFEVMDMIKSRLEILDVSIEDEPAQKWAGFLDNLHRNLYNIAEDEEQAGRQRRAVETVLEEFRKNNVDLKVILWK